jgi:predicted transcriptional regulator
MFRNKIFEKVSSYNEKPVVDKNIVLQLHKEGLRNIDISKKINCSRASITYLLKKYDKN